MTPQVRPYPIAPLRSRSTLLGREYGRKTGPRRGRWDPLRTALPPLSDRAARVLKRLLAMEPTWSWQTVNREVPTTAGHMGFQLVAADAPARPAFLLIPTGAAQALADRMLGADWDGVAPPLPAIDDLSLGVLMYGLCRLLAANAERDPQRQPVETRGTGRAYPPSPAGALNDPARAVYQALEAYPSPERLRGALKQAGLAGAEGLNAPWVYARGHLTLEEKPVPCALLCHRSELPEAPRPTADLRRFGDVRLTVYARGGRGTHAQAAVASLGVGDVVTWDTCSLVLGPAGYEGTAELAVDTTPLRKVGVRCDGDTMEVVMDERDTTTLPTGTHVPDTDPTEAALALGGDAPVTLELELARFTLTLQELAALRPGDLLHAGKPVGEQVVLRVGPRVIARGDLVDVDGEIGVTVTEVIPVDPQR